MAIVFSAFVGFNGPDPGVNHEPCIKQNKVRLFELLESSDLAGYTVTQASGVYGGMPEPSAVITVIAQTQEEAIDCGAILAGVCRAYKEAAKQESVWITRHEQDLLIL